MLLGEYEHTIDDKNRLTLPASSGKSWPPASWSREAWTKRSMHIRQGTGGKRFQARVAGLDPLRAEAGSSSGTSSRRQRGGVDKQGRIMIPAALLKYAGLSRDVVVAGVSDHLEIWDREAWRRELDEVEGSAEHVAERLAAKRD